MTARGNLLLTDKVENLIAFGLKAGGLSMADIQQSLPLDSMTTAELEALITRMEAAGVAVDIDPALLAPRPDTASAAATNVVAPVAARAGPDASTVKAAGGPSITTHTTAPQGFDVRPSRLYVRRSAKALLFSAISIVVLALAALVLWQVA